MYMHETLLFPSSGRSNYRIPAVITEKDGSVLAFCNDRHNSLDDHAEETALVYSRKKPGQDWESIKELDSIPGWCCMIGNAVHDAETGTSFITVIRKPIARDEFGNFTDEEVAESERRAAEKARASGIEPGHILFSTEDGGDTWNAAPICLSARPFTPEDGRTVFIDGMGHGSASGIQLRRGSHAGRLLCPSRIFTGRYSTWDDAIKCCYNNSIYSDDHGVTWHASAPVQQGTGEGALIEDENGVIHYNSRNMRRDGTRLLATSVDGGETYRDFRTAEFIYEEKNIGCSASLIRVDAADIDGLPGYAASVTLFANPRADVRENMTICVSFDNGKTWSHTRTVWPGGSAYSCLTYDKHSQRFFLLYEKGESAKNPYEYGISLIEFDLEWLMRPDRRKLAYFRLDNAEELIHYPDDNIRQLDWHDDLEMIRRFYKNFTDDVIDPPDKNDNCGNPIAMTINGEIAAYALPFSFKSGETEIGAVATVPEYRNRGFCRAVISELARRILAAGLVATLTTGADNIPMQTAAKAIGMHTIIP